MAKINRLWTKEEVELLYLWSGYLPLEEICVRLKRTEGSVRAKSFKLKVGLMPEVNNLSVLAISKILGCDHKSLTYWIKKGKLKAKKANPTSLKPQWRVSRYQFKNFYNANKHLRIFQNVPQENLDWLIKGL